MDNIEPRGTLAVGPEGIEKTVIDLSDHVDPRATILLDERGSETYNVSLEVKDQSVIVTRTDLSTYGIAQIHARSTKDGKPVELRQVVTLVAKPEQRLVATVVADGKPARLDLGGVFRDAMLTMTDAEGVARSRGGAWFMHEGNLIFEAGDGFVSPRGEGPERAILVGHLKESGRFAACMAEVTVVPAEEA